MASNNLLVKLTQLQHLLYAFINVLNDLSLHDSNLLVNPLKETSVFYTYQIFIYFFTYIKD